jgi:hypothetical protein
VRKGLCLESGGLGSWRPWCKPLLPLSWLGRLTEAVTAEWEGRQENGATEEVEEEEEETGSG